MPVDLITSPLIVLKSFCSSQIKTIRLDIIPSRIDIAAGDIESDVDLCLVDCSAKSNSVANFGYLPMPVVVIIHIAYPSEYSPPEDTPDRDAQLGLERHHDVVAKHVAIDASDAVLSAKAW